MPGLNKSYCKSSPSIKLVLLSFPGHFADLCLQCVKVDRADQLVEAAVAQVHVLEFAVGTLIVRVLSVFLILPQNKVPAKHVWVSLWEDSGSKDKELEEEGQELGIEEEPKERWRLIVLPCK